MNIDVSRNLNAPPRVALDDLRASLGGAALVPGDEGYDDARAVWNAMIDRRPAVIVCPTGTADVIAAVNFARENGLPVSIRGGGHNVAGHAVCDGGLMINLGQMRGVRVDRSSPDPCGWTRRGTPPCWPA